MKSDEHEPKLLKLNKNYTSKQKKRYKDLMLNIFYVEKNNWQKNV
jgi:hypothetical protein